MTFITEYPQYAGHICHGTLLFSWAIILSFIRIDKMSSSIREINLLIESYERIYLLLAKVIKFEETVQGLNA